jgi:hypothetical protein
MGDEKELPEKKDMTAIFELPQADLPSPEENADPFAVNVMPEGEHVDTFESIDQIGMMDHVSPEPTIADPVAVDEPVVTDDPFSVSDLPAETMPVETHPTENPFSDFTNDFAAPVSETPPAPFDAIEEIKQYSENTRGTHQDLPIHHPFHLMLHGQFGPFERDKLLLFITENQFGIGSSDLDLQIKSGRVLFPRISEYAGIRLIQELRDSGLQFSLKPSSRDGDEPIDHAAPLKFQFDLASVPKTASLQIALLADDSTLLSQYDELELVQGHQFIKAEMIEVERSDLFQEVIERMTEALKQKVRSKGGQAMTRLNHKITSLRLPSQYQISVSATALRKRI